MIQTDPQYLLFIEPHGSKTGPVDDELTQAMEKELALATAGVESGSEISTLPIDVYKDIDIMDSGKRWNPIGGYRGVHVCSCGEASTNQNYLLPNGMITNSLCVHYLRDHREEVPEFEIEKVRSFAKKSEAKSSKWLKISKTNEWLKISQFDPDAWRDAWVEKEDEATSWVVQKFRNNPTGSQPWQVAPFARVKKIWTDYARLGFVRDEKGLFEIAQIVVQNIFRLHANTVLAGHTQIGPDKFLESAGYEWTEEESEKFGDHIIDEQSGQWRISDYGMKQLLDAAQKLLSNPKAEESLLIIDQVFNVVHQRSDLAALFLEGGSDSLLGLANQLI